MSKKKAGYIHPETLPPLGCIFPQLKPPLGWPKNSLSKWVSPSPHNLVYLQYPPMLLSQPTLKVGSRLPLRVSSAI